MTEAQEIAQSMLNRYLMAGGVKETLASFSVARAHVRLADMDYETLSEVQTDNVAEALVLLATRQPLDQNVREVQRRLGDRAIAGLGKYKVTTERTDIDLVGWLTHLQEELLDAAVYIERTLSDLPPRVRKY